jgi:hypothetical protein
VEELAMAAQTISGAFPVTFVGEDTAKSTAGVQYQIPLSQLTYDSTATPPVQLGTGWTNAFPSGSSEPALAAAYVQNLINAGVLTVDS